MYRKFPSMIPPLFNKINFNWMVEYINNVLLGRAPEINNTDIYTNYYLRHLSMITENIPYNASSKTL